tara:strand:- start:338 stop:763 length:426 start_codon:yes stop_codon:yes gene_type:complete
VKHSILNFSQKAGILFVIALLYFAALPNQSVYAQTEPDNVFEKVDEMPSPEGGIEGWNNYLATNMKYPKEAKKAGVEGRVVASFVVLETGEISNVEIIRGIGKGCDEEVLRMIKESPKWTPGKKDGKVVKTKMSLPVNFAL